MIDPLKVQDPALAAALDRFAPPPLSPGFGDRLEAARAARVNAQARMSPVPRRTARGAWTRGRQALLGIAAFGLVSAAAAATGVFGPITRETPVLGPIMASVAPSVIAKSPSNPKPVRKAQARMVRKTVPPVPEPQPTLADADSTVETRAQAIADRLERRAERRAALGLPPKPATLRKIREKLRAMPPEERRATIQRVRELRRNAIANDPAMQARLNQRAERRAAILAMTPEERRAWRAERRARRAELSAPEPPAP